MKTYLMAFWLAWQNGFVYRSSLLLWRLRQFLSTVMALVLWGAIFQNQSGVFGYTQSSMTTYILLAATLQSIVLSTAFHGLAGTVYSGELSRDLLKPINLFLYWAGQDLADKLRNVLFLVMETLFLVWWLKPVLIFPGFSTLGLVAVWVIAASVIHFWITLLFGALGFWSSDVWAPKFFFFVIINFTAGKLFPLNVLPDFLQRILSFTPFPLLTYAPTQLFLGTLTTAQIWQYSFSFLLWAVGLWAVTVFVWQKGLKSYTASGQ